MVQVREPLKNRKCGFFPHYGSLLKVLKGGCFCTLCAHFSPFWDILTEKLLDIFNPWGGEVKKVWKKSTLFFILFAGFPK